jgi:hypothetical protein
MAPSKRKTPHVFVTALDSLKQTCTFCMLDIPDKEKRAAQLADGCDKKDAQKKEDEEMPIAVVVKKGARTKQTKSHIPTKKQKRN